MQRQLGLSLQRAMRPSQASWRPRSVSSTSLAVRPADSTLRACSTTHSASAELASCRCTSSAPCPSPPPTAIALAPALATEARTRQRHATDASLLLEAPAPVRCLSVRAILTVSLASHSKSAEDCDYDLSCL